MSGKVEIDAHWMENIASAAALLEGTANAMDKREADALRKLVKSAKPIAADAQSVAAEGGVPDGKSIKQAMMSAWAHLPDSVLGHPARMQWLGERFLKNLATQHGENT